MTISEPARSRHVSAAARSFVVASAVTLASSCLIPASAAGATTVECAPTTPGGPLLVTPDCVDPVYNKPVIDKRSDETSPVALHKISGHFDGTTTHFTIYLPARKRMAGPLLPVDLPPRPRRQR